MTEEQFKEFKEIHNDIRYSNVLLEKVISSIKSVGIVLLMIFFYLIIQL